LRLGGDGIAPMVALASTGRAVGWRGAAALDGALDSTAAWQTMCVPGERWRRMMELKGKTAIVTGGARGIGRGIAYELAKEGVRVAVADLPSVSADRDETVAEIKRLGSDAIAIDVDVRDEAQVQAMVQKTIDAWGQVDILVNNAGVIKVGLVMMMAKDDWEFIHDVNVLGTFLCSKAVANHMMQQRSGRIVNLSSMAGKTGRAGASSYCASKFAVIGLTQAMAEEMGQFNVTVNAICPGEVDTYMWREVLTPVMAMAQGITKEEAWERAAVTNVPLRRPQTVEDMGQAVVFLCKADNITGESINVTGGSEMH
jgi:meso-butanediol dehydrogenase/(S,S)-butanediol dehydrogenase/diacetyl reductase